MDEDKMKKKKKPPKTSLLAQVTRKILKTGINI